MSAKYFIPYCIKPLILQKNEHDAKMCGFVNGVIYSLLLTLIVAAAGGRFYFKEENLDTRKKLLHFILIGLAVVWIVFPFMSWYGHGSIWVGYQTAITDLMSQEGYTRQQAISVLQGAVESGPDLSLSQGLTSLIFAKSREEKEHEEQTKPPAPSTE